MMLGMLRNLKAKDQLTPWAATERASQISLYCEKQSGSRNNPLRKYQHVPDFCLSCESLDIQSMVTFIFILYSRDL